MPQGENNFQSKMTEWVSNKTWDLVSNDPEFQSERQRVTFD